MELMMAVQGGVLQEVKEAISSSPIPVDDQWLDYAALNNAIEFGHALVAEYLLNLGCRVNMDIETDCPSNTPLHNAVVLEDVDLVEKLLTKDASILSTNAEGNSPLHIAFLLKNEKIMDMLLDALQRKNDFTNVKNNYGLSHMHIACTRKHNKVVESFVAAGVDLNDCVDEDAFLWSGYSALHFAIDYRSINAVKAILNSSVMTNLTIEDAINNLTPLNFVLQQLEDLSVIAKLLLDKKVEIKDSVIREENVMKEIVKTKENLYSKTKEIIEEIEAKEIHEKQDLKEIQEKTELKEDNDKQDLKEINEKQDLKEIQEKKINSTTGLSSFHLACMENNSEVIEYFIANGASVHQPVISHIDLFHLYTPLHLAVENKCKKTVEILLKHEADVNLQNNDKMTPLHLAFYVNDHEDKQHIIDYLYAAVGSKLSNPKDVNGLSYLHIACTRNDLKTITNLLDVGEDVNAQVQRNSRNVPNFTPLHFAVEYQHVEVAKLLIERGATVNRYSLQGTPLHLACKLENVTLVGLLLDSGARVDCTSTLHPLIEAYKNSKNPLWLNYMERLIGLGVNVDAKDAQGNTALHVFCLEFDEKESCVRFLLDLGANINVENDECKTAFELYPNSAVFYHHVQELKALGAEVNPKNSVCCWKMLNTKFCDEETLERKRQQRIDEITCMKSIKLSKHVSLEDFLKLDAQNAAVYAGNDVLKLVTSTNDLIKYFPSYAYLIKLQYCRALGSFGVGKYVDEGLREAKRKR